MDWWVSARLRCLTSVVRILPAAIYLRFKICQTFVCEFHSPSSFGLRAINRGPVCVRTHIYQAWTIKIPTSLRKRICECRLHADMYQACTFLKTECGYLRVENRKQSHTHNLLGTRRTQKKKKEEELFKLKCAHECEVSCVSIVDWYNFCKEVCIYILEAHAYSQIGGEGIVVEIDENKFGKRNQHSDSCCVYFYRQAK